MYWFLFALSDIDPNSTPGKCMMSRFGSTNAEALGWDGETYDMDRIRILYNLVKNRFEQLMNGELIADDIKIFIKREPHKIQKIKDGRLRLISSVSLVDAMIDRILFMKLQKKQIRLFNTVPIMIGWSPLNGGYRFLDSKLRAASSKYLLIDKSSWDWTVPGWMIDLLLRVIKNLAIQAPDWWLKVVESRFELLFSRPTYVFSDGSLAEQVGRGIMKSGCYLTIFLNSIAQLLLHELIIAKGGISTIRLPYCLGDDTIQGLDEEFEVGKYVEIMESFGFKPKVQVSHEKEFAGFIIDCDKYLPSYRQKHLFLLSHLTKDDEIAKQTLQSYQLLYAFDKEMIEKLRKICIGRGYVEEIYSDFYLKHQASGLNN